MCLYDNKSVVILAKEKIGFIIESNEYAQAQKAIFNTIWNISTSQKDTVNTTQEKDDDLDYWAKQ